MSVFTLVPAWVVFFVTCFMLGNVEIFSLMLVDLSDASSGYFRIFIRYGGCPYVMSNIPLVLFIITSSMMGDSETSLSCLLAALSIVTGSATSPLFPSLSLEEMSLPTLPACK